MILKYTQNLKSCIKISVINKINAESQPHNLQLSLASLSFKTFKKFYTEDISLILISENILILEKSLQIKKSVAV